MRSIASTDEVTLAVHDFGGNGRTVFLSHATGFHGRVWTTIAKRLHDRYHCVAVDYRGHGDSNGPADGNYVWTGFADDTCAVIDDLAEQTAIGGRPFGLGHSKGGASLLMAELRRPGTFAALVLFEPVVLPPEIRSDDPIPIAAAARRRRAEFDSYDAALANFAGKPPLNSFDPETLREYVYHGLKTTDTGTVRLKCHPEDEARTFEGARQDIWEHLEAVRCPVLILAGREASVGPASVAQAVASRLPNGEIQSWPFLSHFGPQEAPGLIAETAASFFAAHH